VTRPTDDDVDRADRGHLAGGRLAGLVILFGVATVAVTLVPDVVSAHAGSIRGATQRTLAVPTWLFLATGGAVVGASFLLASFATDRAFLRRVHAYGTTLPSPGRIGRLVGGVVGVVGLAAILYFGVAGPDTPFRNLAILLVWVAFWAGYVATTYLVGNSWPAINPLRAIVDALAAVGVPTGWLAYPPRLGAWPGVAALLALVYVEVVSPLADDPRLLAIVVGGYAAVSVLGGVAVGPDVWFRRVDPVAKLLAAYGRAAPVRRIGTRRRADADSRAGAVAADGGRGGGAGGTDRADRPKDGPTGGLSVRLPGAGLTDAEGVAGVDEAMFVVAVLYVTTFDGFVGTAAWGTVARTLAGVGVPPTLIYLGSYLVGFGLFAGAYWLAAASARRTADAYLSTATLARRYAPPLLAIAAGYHLAHNLGALLTLAPTLATVLAAPVVPPQNPPQLAGLPAWFGGLEIAFVLIGHLVAVWVAHATAFELFPSRLQAVRSQYGVTLVMVLYTMTSLWIVAAPYAPPPFLTG
jgi:hypothetical protein